MVRDFGRRREEERVNTELIIAYFRDLRIHCSGIPEYMYAFANPTLVRKLSRVETKISPRELVNVIVLALSEVGDADKKQHVPDILRALTFETFPKFGEQAIEDYSKRVGLPYSKL